MELDHQEIEIFTLDPIKPTEVGDLPLCGRLQMKRFVSDYTLCKYSSGKLSSVGGNHALTLAHSTTPTHDIVCGSPALQHQC